MNRFENDKSGYRIATSVGGTATGERADYVVVDDPLSVSQAESDVERQAAVEWFFGTMTTRLNDIKSGHRIVIQQRLHAADVVGEIKKRNSGYELLVLPAEYDPATAISTCIWSDPRTEPGQVLWPERMGLDELAKLKLDLGSFRYSAQYQQSPAPAGGGIWKKDWIRFYRRAELPVKFDRIILSWDAAFKDKKTSDFVAGQCWGSVGAYRYLLDRYHERADFPATVQAVRSMKQRWPDADTVLIEDAANGPAIVATLRSEIEGVLAVQPGGSKVARASAVAPAFEAGQIFIPHPEECPWSDELVLEWTTFPVAPHDDEVDSASMALRHIARPVFERVITR